MSEAAASTSAVVRAPEGVSSRATMRTSNDPGRREQVALAAGVLAMAVAVGLTAAVGWDREHPLQAVTPRLAYVATFGLAAILAMRQPATARFGRVLAVVGLLFGLVALNGSSQPWLYSIGRILVPFAELGLVYAALAFPDGRLVLRRNRVLMAALGCAVFVLWVPAVLLGREFQVGGPLGACGDRCPPNAFAVSHQATIASWLSSLVFLVLMVGLLAVIGSLAVQYRSASPVLRRKLLIGTTAGVLYSAVLASYAGLSATAPHAAATAALGWLVIGANLAIPLAVIGVLLRERLVEGDVLMSLFRELMVAPDAVAFRVAIADLVDDPTLRLARRNRDGELIDLRGRPLAPSTGPDRMVSEVPGTADELLLVHDPALKYDVGLFDAVCKAVAVAYNLNLQRLRVDGLVRDLESTRERLTAASEAERHRLERDLHDGAQQGFVAAQMWLGIARTELERGSSDAGSAVDEAAAQLDHAIEQLRELAHGIYPSTLTRSGVAPALRAAASSATLPTAIRGGHVGRFPKDAEAAVYFACLEAMQNADKHAGPDARVTVELTRDADAVEFTVSDDGLGFDRTDAADPRGVVSVRDRIRPFGGTATIRSARGEGTTVTGRVPVRTMQVA